jgi:hypothetical protein
MRKIEIWSRSVGVSSKDALPPKRGERNDLECGEPLVFDTALSSSYVAGRNDSEMEGRLWRRFMNEIGEFDRL